MAMVQPEKLIVVGYWDGPEASGLWPNPQDMIDKEWDPDDRSVVAAYVSGGVIVRSFMGFSTCRICGHENGNLEWSDGTYVWPQGFGHYLTEHDVRPPAPFVEHALHRAAGLEDADRDDTWWRSLSRSPVRPKS
jgi:hypothetical protein